MLSSLVGFREKKNYNNSTLKAEEHYVNFSEFDLEINNGYKGLEKVSVGLVIECAQPVSGRKFDYSSINSMVNFYCKNKPQICMKYQLIYYDENKFSTPKDVVDNFDFDFCSSYFDGKNIYIKNYASIINKKCIVELQRPRIYKNLCHRIIKYLHRGYEISANLNGKIYKTIFINSNDYLQNKNLEHIDNLIIICSRKCSDITNFMNNLTTGIKRIIIYTYPVNTIINNLPPTVKTLRLYIWKEETGMENYIDPNPETDEEYFTKINMTNHRKNIFSAIEKIQKIPFGCQIFINDREPIIKSNYE
jgi:hypothetical protein